MLKNWWLTFLMSKSIHFIIKIHKKLGLKVKECLEFSEQQRLKPYIEFNTKKKQKLKKFMNNVVFVKKDKNLRNEIGERLSSNKKDHLK